MLWTSGNYNSTTPRSNYLETWLPCLNLDRFSHTNCSIIEQGNLQNMSKYIIRAFGIALPA